MSGVSYPVFLFMLADEGVYGTMAVLSALSQAGRVMYVGGMLPVHRCFPALPSVFLFRHLDYKPSQMHPFFRVSHQQSVFVANRWFVCNLSKVLNPFGQESIEAFS